MTILVKCPKCSKELRAPSEAEGKRGKCRSCGNSILIKASSSSVQRQPAPRREFKLDEDPLGEPTPKADLLTPPEEVKRKQKRAHEQKPLKPAEKIELLSKSFGEGYKRPRVSFTYRIAALICCGIMVLCPIIYVAIILCVIAAVGLGVVLGALALSEIQSGKAVIVVGAGILGLILAGSITVFFMFKPLLSRPSKRQRRRSITRQGEPVLFALVDQICETIRAPKPVRINIDADVNASASYGSGLLSMLGGRELTLTIGAPLIAGLTVNQFAGVLAHEFGHFSQGGGMRVSALIHMIAHWFARVVYQRDSWDDWLRDMMEDEDADIRVRLFFALSQLFVYIVRGILWCLMMIGMLFCSALLRQMEYHADLCEIRLCGSDNFADTTKRLHELAAGSESAYDQVVKHLARGQLVDDVPGLMVEAADSLSYEKSRALKKELETEETGLLDSHPSPKDRVAAAKKERADAVFNYDGPASMLFEHFEAIKRNVTADMFGVLRR